MNPVLFPWMIAVGLVSADEIVNAKHLPIPSRFLASFVIFGLLGALADTSARPIAAATAWGLDVAMFLAFTQTRAGVLSTLGQYLAQTGSTSPATTIAAPKITPAANGSPAPTTGVLFA